MDKRFAIFDMDGTLLDSMYYWRTLAVEFVRSIGFEPDEELGEDAEAFENMLGDIVLSLEKCRTQAAEFGHSFERECAFLTVHSTLHLLGYDHVNSAEEEQDMRARQTAIVEQMGLGVKEV